MKKLRISCIISTILLLLIAGPIATQGRLDGITVGDTIEYEIKKFEVVPIDYLFGLDGTIDPNEAVVDLTGSSYYIKVMDTESNGYYIMNSYYVLAKDIEIPVPDDEHSEEDDVWTEIFGDTITIPKGVGFGLGATVPGSDLLDYINNPEDDYYYGGTPLYHDPEEWDNYEEFYREVMYENGNYSYPDPPNPEYDWSYSRTTYVTVVQTSSEFILEVTMEYTSEDKDDEYGQISKTTSEMTNVWFLKGSYAGLYKKSSQFTSYNVTYTGSYYEENDIEDYEYSTTMEMEYKDKKSRPLPIEIINKDDVTLKVENATADYTTTGFLDQESINRGLNLTVGNLTAAEGYDFLKYDIKNVKGCYYETEIHTYNYEKQQLVEQPGSVWWNGLTGFPTYKYEYGFTDFPFDYWSPTIAIFPFSPGVTPDWEMWLATANSGEAIFQFIVNIFTSQSAMDAISEFGLTINDFSLHSEIRATADLRYMYIYGTLDISFDSNDIDPDHKNEDWIADQTVDIVLSFELYAAYTERGLLAGFGTDFDFSLDFAKIPWGEDYDGSQYVPNYIDGGMTFNLKTKLINKEIDEVPDAADADPWTAIKPGGITPGFVLIPTLLFLSAIVAIIKRRKE